MKKLFHILISFLISSKVNAAPMYSDEFPRFDREVLSKNLTAKCDAQKGDERGPFGIEYKDGKTTHTFLVMTGVYYDTCKGLERKINKLKRQNSKVILIGTEANPAKEPNEIIWRWRAVRSLSGNVCISYFANDCFK